MTPEVVCVAATTPSPRTKDSTARNPTSAPILPANRPLKDGAFEPWRLVVEVRRPVVARSNGAYTGVLNIAGTPPLQELSKVELRALSSSQTLKSR
jgi:hypothetical protein